MKVKVRKRKPAPIATEQAKRKSTLERLRRISHHYGVPKETIFDDYKPDTSKSN